MVSRKEEVMAIKSKFPTKIPLIVERYHKERSLPTLDKSKFLVPEDITMSQFLVIIRNRIRIKPNQALYLIINNKSMLSMSLTMAQAYDNYGDEDGFLYITYASQEVFGYKDEMNIKQSNQEVQAIRHRFPNKVPLYVERYSREREVPALGRNKFLVPQELTMSQFLYIIRNKDEIKRFTELRGTKQTCIIPQHITRQSIIDVIIISLSRVTMHKHPLEEARAVSLYCTIRIDLCVPSSIVESPPRIVVREMYLERLKLASNDTPPVSFKKVHK
ncbi:hypothetical protein HW555_009408 [Spodoptera exigua]|uniref:Uncharacterized protein n=1 Tax=Spodoptera exigua TaxID=7107 RepID=A0A835GCG0_SPOEX|nr:hypothetical protein HW555_009408 [Spodoptera exigua]